MRYGMTLRFQRVRTLSNCGFMSFQRAQIGRAAVLPVLSVLE